MAGVTENVLLESETEKRKTSSSNLDTYRMYCKHKYIPRKANFYSVNL